MIKYIIGIVLSTVCLVASSQVNSEIYSNECGLVIVNDFETTPYLDTLLYHFNYELKDIMEYEVINALNVKDFTCVKTYEVIHGETPVIRFTKPNIHCYEIGWSKVSLLHIGFVDDSCGVSTTTLFMFP